jgi:flavodoxin I
MKNIGIYYGSTTGTTAEIATKIASKLGIDKSCINEVTALSEESIKNYEVLLLGTSTWGCGELQDDWYDGIEVLKKADLTNKTIAFFGCGDSDSYGDTFCDGIGLIYEALKDKGCRFIGFIETEGYMFDASLAVIDHQFIGLVVDEINEPEKTDERIDNWLAQIKNEL